MGAIEDLGLVRCKRCKSLKWPKEMCKTPAGKQSKVCQFCRDQEKLELRHAREKKPKPMLTMLRSIEPELKKLEATMWQTERRTKDIRIRLSQNISGAIRMALKGIKSGKHWEDIVGYTITELIIHLESQFTENMGWHNYGKWEIDHIVPITVWVFSSYEDVDFKRCWNFRNLRPLWKKDNQKKSGKYTEQFQFDKYEELKLIITE